LDNFYNRNHPKNAHPESPKFKRYWKEFTKKMIEGIWINDEGTWVYMPPKLFFYVNYPLIVDANRDDIHPDLRDNEWIIFTYFLCMEGFSGFEGDSEYTSHYLIEKYEKSQDKSLTEKQRKSHELNFVDLKKIPDSAKNPDGTYKKYIEPWYYLTRHYLIDKPFQEPMGHALYENPKYNGCILSARGVGKAQKLDDLIRTKGGWCKLETLEIGDFVYGGDGNLTEIKEIHDHENVQFYKINLRDGRKIEVCEDHLWKVWDKFATANGKRGGWVIKPTKELASSYVNLRIDSKYRKKHNVIKQIPEYRYAVPLSKSLQDETKKDLSIDPYVLGVLLGDGCISQKSITFTTADPEIAESVSNRLSEGFSVKKHKSNKYGYNIKSSKSGFYKLLQSMQLFGTKSDSKFIPVDYLYGSEDQRLDLLKGLMDTDGWSSDRGIIEYYTVSDKLADDFMNLARSLGIGCSRRVKKTHYKVNGVKVNGKDCHRIRLTTNKPIFSLKRKLKYLDHIKSSAGRSRYDKTYITGIELSGKSNGRCISIDNDDNTYITNDYIRTHNSFTAFVGDFLHEFLTGGIKRFSDIGTVNKRLLFGMGAAAAKQLQRSINNVKAAYNNMPGQYKFKDPNKSPYMGPFFKKVQGGWEVGSEINHIVKAKNHQVDIQGSSLQMVALTKDRTTIAAGDRFRRIYVEEFGFLANAIDVHGSNKDSLRSEGIRVGSAIYLGTGGDMNAIRQPKEIFQNPEAYDIFGIPNYWSKGKKKCGLFIPKIYALRDYKDNNGNTYIDLAYKSVIEKRQQDKDELDSISYELEIMFNPLVPEEMLRPGNSTLLPKQEAQDQLNNLETYDIFRKRAQIGKLTWDVLEDRGVKWTKDLLGQLKPILETRIDDTTTYTNKEGAIIIYEQPPEYIPESLYWVVYDPAARSGDGESFHSIIVYKHFYSGSEKTYYDTVVAEWIGRKERLDDNYEVVIKMARYFNARIFPEINVAGFVEWCLKNNYGTMLEGDAHQLEQEIHGNSAIKRSWYKVGFQMNKRKKNWALKKLRDWLLEVKEVDALSGIPLIRTMDWILSPRILNEIIEYTDDPNENFDHVSSLLGLMLLVGKLDGKDPANLEEESKERFDSNLIPLIITNEDLNASNHSQRCKFLNY
jgi:hypothetical protein